jgi:nicotinamide mononucleotide transporter
MINLRIPVFNAIEKSLIIGILIANAVVSVVTNDVNWIGILAAVAGVFCVVLTAKGHISCYYWGFVNIAAYAFICWETKLYGEFIENVGYYLPMQFIGLFLWSKNMRGDERIVNARRITLKEAAIGLIVLLIGTLVSGVLLRAIDGYMPYLDGSTTILAFLAMYLSVKRFTEQWIVWIIIDIIKVIIWSIAFAEGKEYALPMICMWLAYLVNAFYGYYNWRRLERQVVSR